jgi:hypothetical protein
MRASVGDHVLVHGRHVGEHDRTGLITMVRGLRGEPPYVVRWDDGSEAVYFPSADCVIEQKKV